MNSAKVNSQTLNKFRRLLENCMAAHKQTAEAGDFNTDKFEWAEHDEQKTIRKLEAEFKKYSFTEEQWNFILTECGVYDCGFDFEYMD